MTAFGLVDTSKCIVDDDYHARRPEMISGPSQSRCAPKEQASNAMGRGDSAGATSGNAEPGTNRDAMAGIEEIDSKLSDLVSTFREEQEGTRVAIRGLQRDAGLIDFNLCFLGSLLFIVGWLAHVNREFFTLLTWILPPLAIYQFHIKELKEKRRKMQAQMERGRICIEHVKLKLLGYVAPVIAGALFSINPEVGKMVSWALSPYAVYRVLGVSG